jgi:hypothetical protein
MWFCLPRQFLPVSVCVTQILVGGGAVAIAAFPPPPTAPAPHPKFSCILRPSLIAMLWPFLDLLAVLHTCWIIMSDHGTNVSPSSTDPPPPAPPRRSLNPWGGVRAILLQLYISVEHLKRMYTSPQPIFELTYFKENMHRLIVYNFYIISSVLHLP